jgi:hypothetical protein
MPVSGCKSLSSYSVVNLTPFDTSTTIVSAAMRDNVSGSLRGYVQEINDQLRTKLEATKKFSRVTDGAECGGQSLRIEGKIVALEQDRSKLRVLIRGNILQCSTGEVLYRFEQDDTDSALLRTAEIIADRLVVDIANQMTCEAAGT